MKDIFFSSLILELVFERRNRFLPFNENSSFLVITPFEILGIDQA